MRMGKIDDEYFQEIIYNDITHIKPIDHMWIVVCIDLSIGNRKMEMDKYSSNGNSQWLLCMAFENVGLNLN